MKKVMLLVLCLLLVMPTTAHFAATPADGDTFRAVWVATVLNLDYPSRPTTNSETLKAEADRILDYVEETGLNAVVLQVRPSGDAFYKSALYPWSKYLTGTQGTAPDMGFDPLTYWVEEAHKRGIEVHAWLNPYRVTKKTSKETAHDYSQLSADNPTVQNPDWVVAHKDGNLYLDPGNPEVTAYILDGVEEILENYAVDGIHYDDYFYPSKDFDDAATYRKYRESGEGLSDFRRRNTDELVRQTNEVVKAYNAKNDASVEFGVSPFAIWANKSSMPEGSDTAGLESYFSHYADTKKWVESQWLDYIAPQIYWEIGFKIADYKTLLAWWTDVVEDTDVKLYVGQAPYRITYKDKESPWYGHEEIMRQMDLNTQYGADGSIFFRYAFMAQNPSLTRALQGAYGVPITDTYQSLAVTLPVEDKLSTTSKGYYIGGVSDMRAPLTVNGETVVKRSGKGYFGYFVPLEIGTNRIVVQNGGTKVVKTIVRNKPSTGGGGTSPSKDSVKALNDPTKYAVVSSNLTGVYSEPSTRNGAVTFVDNGMKDRIVAYTKYYYQLNSGYWIKRDDVSVVVDKAHTPSIKSVEHVVDGRKESLVFETASSTFVKAALVGDRLVISFPNVKSLPYLNPSAGSDFSKIARAGSSYEIDFGDAVYRGHRIVKTSTGYAVDVFKRFEAGASTLPLEGATIMIDPGHGGRDTGALGLLGALHPEKTVVLNTALMFKEALEAQGAEVVMTRDDDAYVSLKDRTTASRELAPDLFVSIHADNASSTIDLSKVEGFSVFYENEQSRELAQRVQDATIDRVGRVNRKVKKMNFYVIRGTWSPALLLETGFMAHPTEFEWLTEKAEAQRLVDTWTDAIVDYFSS